MASVNYDGVKMLGPLWLEKRQIDGDWYLFISQDFRVTNGGSPVGVIRKDRIVSEEEWSTVPQNIKDAVVALFGRAEAKAEDKVGL
jgi:hypothetical protein